MRIALGEALRPRPRPSRRPPRCGRGRRARSPARRRRARARPTASARGRAPASASRARAGGARAPRGPRGAGRAGPWRSATVSKPAIEPRFTQDCPSTRISTLPSGAKANSREARRPRHSSSRRAPIRSSSPRVSSQIGVVDDAGLLGRADHRGVEGLRDQHVDDRHANVGAAVDVDGRVAGTDADARLARLVGGGDGLGPAGGPDEVDARVVEEVLRDVERGVGDHLKRVRAAGPRARPPPGGSRPRAAAHRAARADGPEDDRVARLRRHDRLEEDRGGRVGDRREREHDADRLGHLLDPALGVLVDHADRALVLQVVEEELGRDVVLDRPCPRRRRSRSPPSRARRARRRSSARPRPSGLTMSAHFRRVVDALGQLARRRPRRISSAGS